MGNYNASNDIYTRIIDKQDVKQEIKIKMMLKRLLLFPIYFEKYEEFDEMFEKKLIELNMLSTLSTKVKVLEFNLSDIQLNPLMHYLIRDSGKSKKFNCMLSEIYRKLYPFINYQFANNSNPKPKSKSKPKIGIISNYFYNHSASKLIRGLIENLFHLNKSNITLISLFPFRDKITDILIGNSHEQLDFGNSIEYDEKHPDCQSLLKICPLDDLHENTWNKKSLKSTSTRTT